MDRTQERFLAQSRRGNANVSLLVGVILVVLVVLGLLAYALTARQAQHAKAMALESQHAALVQKQLLEEQSALAVQVEDTTARDASSEVSPAQPAPSSFEGRGTIRGRASTPPNVPFPDRWTLTIEPNPGLEGAERATTRVLEFDGDQVEFIVENLPLGGYAVSASAVDMNSRANGVLLAKGQSNQYVMLHPMTQAGFIDGGVTDSSGTPLEGVPVVLESNASKIRRETQTDFAGNYLFEKVLDGAYTITFGSPDSPLLPSEEILFRSPSLRFPTREIPHDAQLKIQVVDADGRFIPGAKLRGFGTGGGNVEGETDAAGMASFRFLPAGRFRIYASDDQRHGKKNIELSKGEIREVTLELND